MEEKFGMMNAINKNQEVSALRECNQFTKSFGLTLSDSDIQMLMEEKFRSLKNNGRVEFGEGILKKLVFEFCDSPYVLQDNYAETLQCLQEMFYYFKNESLDEYSDDELIGIMKEYFESECQGSVEYLQECKLEDICRKKRYQNVNYDWDDDREEDDDIEKNDEGEGYGVYYK